MKNYNLLFCVVCILIFQNVYPQEITDLVQNYFETSTVSQFQASWVKVKQSYENAVSLALKEAFGTGLQNVFVPRKSTELASAYFITDNVVDILLINLTLKYHIPRLRPYMPDVSLALGDNLLTLNADLDTVFVEADYFLFRNKSDIFYEGFDDPYKTSPFTLHQVQKKGKIIIVAEQCKLVGMATAILKGLSVFLGFSSFQATRCQFRVEIHKPGFSAPPIMAPYFSVDQGRLFERLLSKSLADEMNPKLQGILFSVLNSTSILDLKVGPIRNLQRTLTRKVNEYFRRVVSTMNAATFKSNRGGAKIKDLAIAWDDSVGLEFNTPKTVHLTEMTLVGLETAYCAQAGAPYKVNNNIKVADEIRYQELQVRGKIYRENDTHKEMQGWTIELLDVAVAVKLHIDGKETRRDDKVNGENKVPLGSAQHFSLEFVGWRSLEYYDVILSGRTNPLLQLAVGYVIDEVPRVVLAHLQSAFGKALNSDDTPGPDDGGSANDSEDTEKPDYPSNGKSSEYGSSESDRKQDRGDDSPEAFAEKLKKHKNSGKGKPYKKHGKAKRSKAKKKTKKVKRNWHPTTENSDYSDQLSIISLIHKNQDTQGKKLRFEPDYGMGQQYVYSDPDVRPADVNSYQNDYKNDYGQSNFVNYDSPGNEQKQSPNYGEGPQYVDEKVYNHEKTLQDYQYQQ